MYKKLISASKSCSLCGKKRTWDSRFPYFTLKAIFFGYSMVGNYLGNSKDLIFYCKLFVLYRPFFVISLWGGGC